MKKLGFSSFVRFSAWLLLLSSTAVLLAQTVSPDRFSAMQWRLIGPFRGGRTVAVSGVPGDGAAFFMGSVDGGVWKTPNAGVTWTPLFDEQPIASIGALEVAPSDPNVIYAGTGESDIRSDLSSGDGVYKSIDGGRTWTNIGLRESRQISRIVVDPRDANVVFAAVLGHAYGPHPERGVYKSSDGGKTWVHVLNEGPETGASDLAIASAKPTTLFAGTWQAHRPPWSTYAPLQGGGGLFRSLDAGEKWTRLTGGGLPDGEWGRVGVAVSSDGQRVYALIDAGKKSGLYRSDDGGETWLLANGDPRLTSRAWYFSRIVIDPGNPDVAYVPNVAFYRLSDAGKTITIVRGAPGGDDYHQLWIDPKSSQRMVLSSDQGAAVSLDGGKTWSSWFNQPTAQFYHVTTDNQFPYHVYGAQQDSGSAGVISRSDHGVIGPTDWFMIGGGESGYVVVDPNDPDVLYVTGVYGSVARFNRRTSLSQDITPWPNFNWGTDIAARKYRAPWTPMLASSGAEKNALYLGTQYVMKTTDGGLHWQTISPDLTGAKADGANAGSPATVENATARGYGVVYSIAPSPLEAETIWAGSDTGLVHLTSDGGKNWKDVTPPGLSDWSKIAMIEASHFDPGTAYVVVDRHRLDDQKPYLYRTRDYGKSWQPITSGIGATHFVNAVREDPQQKGLLFAGTELGVYVSFDDGDHWQPLQLNLPASSVRDLTIHGDDLIIATHGRGFWILDDITPLRELRPSAQPAKAMLYRPATAVRIDNDGFLGTPLPPEEPAAKNPPAGALIDYFLAGKAVDLKLEIYDPKGNLVRRYVKTESKTEKLPPLAIAPDWVPKPVRLEGGPGMHRLAWDLRWHGSGLDEGFDADEGYAAPQGPKVAPGVYQVKLTADGVVSSQPLKVEMDPRSPATAAGLEQQQQLALEIFVKTQRSRQALAEMTTVSKALGDLKPQLKTHPDLVTQSDHLLEAIAQIQKGSPNPTETFGLETAGTGLQAALRVVESGDRTAPQQAIDVYRQMAVAADAGIGEWRRLKTGELARLNQQLMKSGLEPVRVAATGPPPSR